MPDENRAAPSVRADGSASEDVSALTVVPAEPAHIPAIAALERVCFSHPWTEQMIAEELENPIAVFRTALLGGRVAGYVGMQAVAGEGYIANLAVDPALRRRGIGERLLSDLLGYARAQGFSFVTLEVRVSNAPAIRLYEKLGFRKLGKRPRFYDDPAEDAWIMTNAELGARQE